MEEKSVKKPIKKIKREITANLPEIKFFFNKTQSRINIANAYGKTALVKNETITRI